MAPIPPARFRRALAGLDGPTFASFVADLWERTGWEVERRGQVVVAGRDGDRRRLLVLPPGRLSRFRRAPAIDEPVDAVVTARADPADRSLPRETPDARIVDADDLRNRSLYGLSRSAGESLFQAHLGVPARDPTWDSRDGRSNASDADRPRTLRARLRSASRPSTVSGTLAVLAIVTVLLLAAVVGVSGTAFGPSNAFADGPDDGGTAESTPAAAASNESAAASVYDVEPTCDRGPAGVAENVSAALTGGEKNRALKVYWEFSNPDYREGTSYSAYVGILRSAFEELFEAERIEHGEPESIGNDSVRIDATVVESGGDRLAYEYELVRWSEEPYDGCWMIEQLAPA